MSKPAYRVMGSKGRVLIPRELRLAAGMYGGDILALQFRKGKVSARKVEIVEVGDQSSEAVEAYVRVAVKTMLDTIRLSLISDPSGLVQEKEENHVGQSDLYRQELYGDRKRLLSEREGGCSEETCPDGWLWRVTLLLYGREWDQCEHLRKVCVSGELKEW